eukprot:scaffold5657_cov270-Pinguiococcus_pyrenoidosus.AAC.11
MDVPRDARESGLFLPNHRGLRSWYLEEIWNLRRAVDGSRSPPAGQRRHRSGRALACHPWRPRQALKTQIGVNTGQFGHFFWNCAEDIRPFSPCESGICAR